MAKVHKSRKLKALNKPLNIATHEAGHAVIARVLTLLCGEATIKPDYEEGCAGYAAIGDPLESVTVWHSRFKRRTLYAVDAAYRARIIACMAGTEAEAELLGAAEGGDGEDLYHIGLLAEELPGCDLDRLRRMTRMLVRRHRKRIERVAKVLLVKETLTEKQIDRLAGRSIADVPDRRPAHFRRRAPAN
jgi:hypothetical protein